MSTETLTTSTPVFQIKALMQDRTHTHTKSYIDYLAWQIMKATRSTTHPEKVLKIAKPRE